MQIVTKPHQFYLQIISLVYSTVTALAKLHILSLRASDFTKDCQT